MGHLRQHAEQAADILRQRFPKGFEPRLFVQLGTGTHQKPLLDREFGTVDMDELPGMPVRSSASPAGHDLRLSWGHCQDTPVLLATGRRHLYEGFGPLPCVLPTCAAVFCGVGKVLQVSAAGAVREDFRPGTTMAVTDFINNLGTSPLVGNQDLGTTPFPDMQEAFSQVALSQFINLTADTGMVPRLGTYQANLGPQFETPTEVEAARRNGADAVGMSLVLETIAARAMGADVIAIAVITNAAASVRGHRISHEDVAEVAAFASRTLHAAIQAYAAGLESG